MVGHYRLVPIASAIETPRTGAVLQSVVYLGITEMTKIEEQFLRALISKFNSHNSSLNYSGSAF